MRAGGRELQRIHGGIASPLLNSFNRTQTGVCRLGSNWVRTGGTRVVRQPNGPFDFLIADEHQADLAHASMKTLSLISDSGFPGDLRVHGVSLTQRAQGSQWEDRGIGVPTPHKGQYSSQGTGDLFDVEL